jgi:hypothetical protein
MAFLMQSLGKFFNQVILIVLLLIFHHGQGGPPCLERVAQWTFRVSFAIPAVGTLWFVCENYFTYVSSSEPSELVDQNILQPLRALISRVNRTLDSSLF